jgi:SMODS-associating 4TM effector domain
MANQPSTGPSMARIGTAQNEESSLRRYLAADHFYGIAKWLHFGGAALTVVLALISPLVLVYSPDAGPALGAIAGAWLFASRLLLEPFRRQLQLKGATAQEMFDCGIFELDWNETLARPLSEEEVRGASGTMKAAERVRDWYPTSEEIAWPKSVLVCQRSNAVWARRQHRTYSRVLLVAAGAWAVIGVIVAVADGATLAAYLVTIALPSLPALLDATEFARAHSSDADKRQLLEDKSNDLLGDGSATKQDLREIQDQLFNLRRNAPLVPGWFYKLVRPKFEEDMRYAARRTAEGGSSGRTGSN